MREKNLYEAFFIYLRSALVFVGQTFNRMSKYMLNRVNFIIIRKVGSKQIDFFTHLPLSVGPPSPLMALISIFHFKDVSERA